MTEITKIRSSMAGPRHRRGVALVITVSMIALMMIMAVALLDTSNDGYKEAVMVAGKDQARHIGEDAVHVAMAHLRDATSQTFASGRPKPWTSQPGGIRVHNMDGTLNTLYKLYSANAMTASSMSGLAADLPDDWAEKPDDFVDLNAPVIHVDGDMHFPIVDPRAMTDDPMTSVEGFDYLEQKGAVGPKGSKPEEQRLPMPVRWLYLLKDGTLGTLSADGVFQSPGKVVPDSNNPLVGRFAFWVDDETSKINVNTASEGAFWDTPRADTDQERALASTVPSRLEYMRHPGHPAGVSLSSVLLPNHRVFPLEFPPGDGLEMKAMTQTDARDLWRLGRLTVADRGEGAALGGLAAADWAGIWSQAPAESTRQPRYAQIEDMLFDDVDPSRFPAMWGNSPEPTSGERRRSHFFLEHPEAVDRVQKSRFFLTTQNAAPEVTLFGTPRVATWPVHAQSVQNGSSLGDPTISRDTVYNHKVIMASTVKEQPYFVVRSEPGNGIRDFRTHLGGANKRLLAYLQRLTDSPFPGFEKNSVTGSTFAAKYGEDRDAILLGIMDYVRSANFAEHQLPGIMQFSVLCPGVEHKGFGQISPLQLISVAKPAVTSNHIQAMGRMLTISEVALIITCRAEVDADGEIIGEPSAVGRTQLNNPGDRELDVGFLVETFLPGHGWTDYRPYANLAMVGGEAGAEFSVDHRKTPLPEFTLNGVTLLPVETETAAESTELPPSSWNGSGGSLGVRCLPNGVLQFKPVVIRAGEPNALNFRTSSSAANQLKVVLYDAPASTDPLDLVQVVPLVLPDILPEAGIPLPRLAKDAAAPDLKTRLLLSSQSGAPFVSATDIVQSLAPLHGDYRLTSTQRWAESIHDEVRTPIFAPHPRWGKQAQAHTLRDQSVAVDAGMKQGYIPSLSYAAPYSPDLPATMTSGLSPAAYWKDGAWAQYSLEDVLNSMRLDSGLRGPAMPEVTGDFDNGLGKAPDGPYNNRPDDGHWAAAKAGKLPYFDNVSQINKSVPPVSLSAFTPQRMIPSPVMFGSLPTGSRAQVPWQTLLFRPQPAHYGAQPPPDHLLLDLFWMPVLEPEPLSSNLETEGKINLNHQILPFSHITRATALHAALKAETLMAIPDTAVGTYKSGGKPKDRFRKHLDARQTLDLWKQEVFDAGHVFLTAGQICDQYLVPEGFMGPDHEVSRSDMEEFWTRHRVTGDNSKERPYAHLYSRLTTRSNTYRVHFIAQSLTKKRSSPSETFNGQRDQITSTYAGSAVIRRQLDLDHPDLPEYQTTSDAKPLDLFYRWDIGRVQPNRK